MNHILNICRYLITAIALGGVFSTRAEMIIPQLPNTPACNQTFNAPTAEIDIPLTTLTPTEAQQPPKQLTLLNLWALWCAPCRQELPLLNKLVKDNVIQVIALNLGDTPEMVQSFLKSQKIDALDTHRSAPDDALQRVHAQGLPYNALFIGNKLIGVRNHAIHKNTPLRTCIEDIRTALSSSINPTPQINKANLDNSKK